MEIGKNISTPNRGKSIGYVLPFMLISWLIDLFYCTWSDVSSKEHIFLHQKIFPDDQVMIFLVGTVSSNEGNTPCLMIESTLAVYMIVSLQNWSYCFISDCIIMYLICIGD